MCVYVRLLTAGDVWLEGEIEVEVNVFGNGTKRVKKWWEGRGNKDKGERELKGGNARYHEFKGREKEG